MLLARILVAHLLCAVAVAVALLLFQLSPSFAQSNTNALALEIPLEDARSLAEAGVPSAQWRMGVRYELGADVPQSDDRAVYWHRKSAEQGYALAQRFMAWSYGRGENGLPLDDLEAMKWGLKAAKQGDAVSQLIVAVGYATGLGVQRNDSEAVKWLHESAIQGLPTAQHQLAIMHLASSRRGTPEDFVVAYAWLNLAAAQGNENAKEGRNLLRNDVLSNEQLAEAQQLSRELQHEIMRRLREKDRR